MPKKRILTGDRPTGRLHLGHYAGSLQNRVQLQDEYDTFILLADVQALTTHFERPALVRDSIYEVALDNLSVGLDPEKVTFVQQSYIPGIAELTVYFSMLVSVNALRHNPTVKTEAGQYGYNELSYGFLGYPVSQAADITCFRADLVPVGEDQLPHMEQARKLVRRFHELYGAGREVLRLPEALLSQVPRLPGLDGGGKMGKSLGNAVYLSDDAATVSEKLRGAVTDPARITRADKGHPEVCTVSRYHAAFNPGEHKNICGLCRSAGIGCVAGKQTLARAVNGLLEPVRERRAHYEARRDEVRDIILTGSEKADAVASDTLRQVREAMHLEL